MEPTSIVGSVKVIKCLMYQQGFTYLGLMLFLVIVGIGLAGAGQVWHLEAQRENERQLLFVGEQFRLAIGSYYEYAAASPKQYPSSLEQLLRDNRSPVTRHHLRKIYLDPMTGKAEWGLVRQKGRIVGIFSLSSQQPIMMRLAKKAAHYSDWQFTYVPMGADNSSADPTPALSTDVMATPSINSTPETAQNESGANSSNSGGGSNSPGTNSNPPPVIKDKSACYAQKSMDYSECSLVCIRIDNETACNACMSSLFSRFNACIQ